MPSGKASRSTPMTLVAPPNLPLSNFSHQLPSNNTNKASDTAPPPRLKVNSTIMVILHLPEGGHLLLAHKDMRRLHPRGTNSMGANSYSKTQQGSLHKWLVWE